MGILIYLAVPGEQDFDAFSSLCAAPFGKSTFEQFLSFVEEEAERQHIRGRRVIGVPLDLRDFSAWLEGRGATRELWLAYAQERAENVRRWPPSAGRFFMSTGAGA